MHLLFHHQLESEFITMIIIIIIIVIIINIIINILIVVVVVVVVVVIITVVIVCRGGRDPGGPQGGRSWTGHNKLLLGLAWQQQNQAT